MYLQIVILVSMVGAGAPDHHARTHQLPTRAGIVHLFEWKWLDIADECERFLAPMGYGGVQVSPPTENLVILKEGQRPWYERYQVMSYHLTSRSGDQRDFLNMTTRCNRVGVRIYADVVINHMTGDSAGSVGTGGSTADTARYSYPAVPYTERHFHRPHCHVHDYNDAAQVRNCELAGLKDLNQTERYVRRTIVGLFNELVRLGVAGFRVDAAKHMWPQDLKQIYDRVGDCSTQFGFPVGSRPYIYQEVIYYGGEPIQPRDYTALGDVTEFRVGNELKSVFRGRNALKWLVSWGPAWGLGPSDTALVFIDNHDTQRTSDVLTYKESRPYKGAIAFMLAHPYGEPRIMSSYHFSSTEQGPPSDPLERILSPTINEDGTCGGGWVCEHRWRQVHHMVSFRSVVRGTNMTHWWDNNNNQIAFARGGKGFIVFNLEGTDLKENLQTGLSGGEYCDVVSGGAGRGEGCTGRQVSVRGDGTAYIHLPAGAEDVHMAIHVGPQSALAL